MLRPLDTPTRERRSLNGLWSFRLDPAGLGRRESWWTAPLAEARQVPVPASYNDLVPDVAFRDHVWPKFLRENAEAVFGAAPHPYPPD